eukprot:276209_1
MACRRLTKELLDLIQDERDGHTTGFSATPSGDDLFEWEAMITGVEGTPYEGGEYLLSITFPHNYPFHPPKVTFDTKIYHGSITEDGEIDCEVLKDEHWTPALTLRKILHTLRSCMSTGGDLECLCRSDIAQEMRTNMIRFVKKVVNHNRTRT